MFDNFTIGLLVCCQLIDDICNVGITPCVAFRTTHLNRENAVNLHSLVAVGRVHVGFVVVIILSNFWIDGLVLKTGAVPLALVKDGVVCRHMPHVFGCDHALSGWVAFVHAVPAPLAASNLPVLVNVGTSFLAVRAIGSTMVFSANPAFDLVASRGAGSGAGPGPGAPLASSLRLFLALLAISCSVCVVLSTFLAIV